MSYLNKIKEKLEPKKEIKAAKIPDIDDPVYHDLIEHRGYTCKVSPLNCHSARDSAAILKYRLPDWSKEEHAKAAKFHEDESKKKEEDWGKTQEKAHMETFGTSPTITDYKISGIGREEYPAKYKDKMRKLSLDSAHHKAAAAAHSWLSKYLRKKEVKSAFGSPEFVTHIDHTDARVFNTYDEAEEYLLKVKSKIKKPENYKWDLMISEELWKDEDTLLSSKDYKFDNDKQEFVEVK